MKYVIIGNGFAGVRAIESIRKNDKKGEITVISDEPNYSRPLITYYLGKHVTKEALPYRDAEFFKKNNVNLKIGKRATKLDVERKVVYIENEEIEFDRLLIATGGSPFVPPIKGKDVKGVYTLTTLANAESIANDIKENNIKEVILLGGGLIGLKATDALMDLGLNVTVVELANRILSATFDKKASNLIQNALKEQHCNVITGDTITEVLSENNRVTGAKLKSGKEIKGDLLIIAIGVRPDISLVKDTPIKTNRGIVVNGFLETSVKDIYAAGDCAENNQRVIAILPLAARQGKIAGHNMSVEKEEDKIKYDGGLPMNSVSLANIPTISVGLTDPKNPEEYQIMEKYLPSKKIYRKIVLHGDEIAGAIFINEIDRAGIFTGLIKNHTDVSSFKDNLMKDNFGLISLPKNYRKSLINGDQFS
ncbi:MAG: NAD(P)/FAD-dependent oxidoreductase [Promethearchaeota archaeon]